MSDTLIIANPAAAAGRAGRSMTALGTALHRVLGPFDLSVTTKRGHASELARRAVGTYRRILSLGGDGTLSEVLHGIMSAGQGAADTELGILPAGTGGDFRRLIHGTSNILSAARHIASGQSFPIDIGHARFLDDHGAMRDRYFINILSFGVGGLVDRLVNDAPKQLGGRASFLIGTARALARYRPTRIELELDGQAAGEYLITNVFVCNGQYGGGGMYFAPNALLDDGVFDVVCVEHRPLLRSLLMTRDIYRGTYDRFAGVHTWRAATVRARTLDAAAAYIDLDGEAPGGLPLEVSLRPRAVRMLCVRPELRQ